MTRSLTQSRHRGDAGIRSCAIIPVFNHTEPVNRVIDALRANRLHVIVVDDGSEPYCAAHLDLLIREDVTLMRHRTNQGKGAAVKTGLARGLSMGFSHALQVDADGQHDLDDIPALLTRATAHPGAMICGEPVFDASIPRVRELARYLTHGMVAINTLSTTLLDAMCGYRVYPLAEIDAILTDERTGNRMDFDPEIMVRWCWRGLPIETVPTRVRYPEDGKSHFRMVRDNWLITRMHTRLFFGMLRRLPRLLTGRFTGGRP